MKPLVSLHVVNYSCPNCGEEVEEVKMCTGCKAPMRVIKTMELYGDEANKYLEDLKEESKKKVASNIDSGVQFDNSVIGVGPEDLDSVEEKEDSVEEDAALELGEIYPDADDEDSDRKYNIGELDSDFGDALDFLDQEDDEISADMKGLPEL